RPHPAVPSPESPDDDRKVLGNLNIEIRSNSFVETAVKKPGLRTGHRANGRPLVIPADTPRRRSLISTREHAMTAQRSVAAQRPETIAFSSFRLDLRASQLTCSGAPI